MNLFGETGKKNEGRKKFDLKRFFLTEFFTILLMTAGLLALHGIPMGKIPKWEDVQTVEITDLSLGVQGKEITEPDEIEMAVKCCKLLSWKPGTPEKTEPEVEMVFRLKDGSAIRFGGNETTAWRDGKAYRIKEEKNLFVNCVRGIFLQAEAMEGREN